MNSPNYDSRTADKFVVRLPDGLRADIEAAANASDRSMNSVFIQAVRQYLDGQNRQQLLLDVLASTVTNPLRVGETTDIPVVSEPLESLPFGSAPRLITENPVVAESPYAAIRVKNIDHWIKTLENAKRYEWLRDVAFDTPRQDLVPRDKSRNMLIDQDLDAEIDCAMKVYPGEQEAEPCAE
ncbi:Arc family DNA-binding protein [Pseudomonas carnis]|uniref:Arc family DNA-binding protein n=1 Tax=Pseudomonas carnis TaxID=2487355 RepID=UPI0030824B75